MSLPSENASNIAATTAQAALQTAANNEFIAEATLVIADAVKQGQFISYMYSIPGMNFQTIFAYFQGLGYIIGNADVTLSTLGPAALFGQFWTDYWNNVTPIMPNYPIKVFVSWSKP